jgi:glycosyltransferase involved in cell wall biosynthesis
MIIVNDSPTDTSYQSFASSINDARIHYRLNDLNKGVNYTRNAALDNISADSQWVIFLDDDDYLAPDALQTFHDLILLNPASKWFLTNRAYKNGKPVTKFPKSDKRYSYARDYLLLRRGKGDATHCIETKLATSASFSKHVKQGEEWFYFFQIGLREKIYYHDHNSTITDGYDEQSGLNFRKRSRGERFESITKLVYEGSKKKLAYHPTFLIYILLRYIRLVL